MNANEVNEVINNICDKIGIGINNAKQFVPALAKYKIVHNALWGFIWLIMFVCLILVFKYLYYTYKKGSQGNLFFDGDPYVIGMIVCGIIAVIVLPVSCGYFVDMVEWIVSPNVKVVSYVLEFVK